MPDAELGFSIATVVVLVAGAAKLSGILSELKTDMAAVKVSIQAIWGEIRELRKERE